MLTKLLRQLIGRRSQGSSRPPVPVKAGSQSDDRQAMLREALRLYRQNDHAALILQCQRHLDVDPDDPDALQFLAMALVARGDLAQGTETLRHAARGSPLHAQIHLALVRLLLKSGAVDEALAIYERASARSLSVEPVGVELSTVLTQLGRYDEAERIVCALLSITPAAAPEMYLLSRIMFEQGRVDEAIELLRALVKEPTVQSAIHSDLLRAMNYSDALAPEEVSRAHQLWDERHAVSLGTPEDQHANSKEVDRRLRIGFVSPYFRKHAVTFFLESVMQALCRDFDVILYADVQQQDEYSARLRAFGAVWRDTLNLDDAQLAASIRADLVDILVDLSGHTPRNRLLAFARRPAPVQMTWNGYPNTTGMQAIDYRITDAYCDPAGKTEHLHRERLLRLPAIYMSWRPPGDAPAVSELPAKRNGYVTFASFNACYKLSPTILQLWARILREEPSSRLLLATVPAGVAQRRIEQAFAAAGIGRERLDFRVRVDHDAFLHMHADADIALDSFPYHGTTTTCFSLWMGVPVVTLAGHSHAARVGVTLLTHSGLPQLIARDADHYVHIAKRLAADVYALARLRAALRQRLQSSPLTDGERCALALGSVCRDAFRTWCTH